MRKLQTVQAQEGYLLDCYFSDGSRKVADIRPYLQSEAFQPLKDIAIFKLVTNNLLYVSWQNEEVDLSADTLWHISQAVE